MPRAGELAYKDRFSQYIVNAISEDTTGDSIDNDLPLELDKIYYLTFKVTGEEYRKVFSSVCVGADLLFGDEAQNVTYILWKAAKGMTFCEQVAECITDSFTVQQALQNVAVLTAGDGGVGNPLEVLPDEIRHENILPDDFTCDNDHRYGTARGVVLAIHEATIEVFQAIEVLTNPGELAAELADNMPIGEVAAVGLEIAVWIQNTMYELYELAWSEVVEDEISCEIFCLMLDEDPCHLDYEMIMDVYLAVGIPSPPSINDPWIDWILWLIDIVPSGAVTTVKVAGLLGLLIMRYGGRFGSFVLGIRSLSTTIGLLANDTDGDWAVLCTACDGRWSHTWDFENFGMEAWTISSDGVYVPGTGVIGQQKNLVPWVSYLISNLQLNETIPRLDTVTFNITTVKGTWEETTTAISINASPIGNETLTQIHLNNWTRQDSTITFPVGEATIAQMFLRTASYTPPGSNGTCIIYSATLEGEGIDPFAGRITS